MIKESVAELVNRIGYLKEANTRLEARVKRLRAGGCARDQHTTQFCGEAVVLQDEVRSLRMKLDLTECHLKDAESVIRKVNER